MTCMTTPRVYRADTSTLSRSKKKKRKEKKKKKEGKKSLRWAKSYTLTYSCFEKDCPKKA